MCRFNIAFCVFYETVSRSARGLEKGPSRKPVYVYGARWYEDGAGRLWSLLTALCVAAGLLEALLGRLCGYGPKPSVVLYVGCGTVEPASKIS